MSRSIFTVDDFTVTHAGIDPWTREPFIRRYWLPRGGGYVYLDATCDGSRPGTLGTQPTYGNGSTWRANSVPQLLDLVRAEWRRERASYRNS